MVYVDLSQCFIELQTMYREQHETLSLIRRKSDEQEKRICALESEKLAQKEILTFSEGSLYTGISKSTLYKMTSGREIPHFKPHGKLIFFERSELDQWLRQHPVKSIEQIHTDAELCVTSQKGKGVNHG